MDKLIEDYIDFDIYGRRINNYNMLTFYFNHDSIVTIDNYFISFRCLRTGFYRRYNNQSYCFENMLDYYIDEDILIESFRFKKDKVTKNENNLERYKKLKQKLSNRKKIQ